jgi:hypothetical protein
MRVSAFVCERTASGARGFMISHNCLPKFAMNQENHIN